MVSPGEPRTDADDDHGVRYRWSTGYGRGIWPLQNQGGEDSGHSPVEEANSNNDGKIFECVGRWLF